MTLIGPGSWEAIRAAADAALTAAGQVHAGERISYALCRPPGHHAGPDGYGGSCYLTNAALAAQELRRLGASRVAIIDIDAHHGNGTQAIFYGRPDVFYGSVHVDPGAGWFPHYMGFADERGSGSGAGSNRNLPLAPRTGDEEWLAAVERQSCCPWASMRRPPIRRARSRFPPRVTGEPASWSVRSGASR
jgi:acetoin utilization deacetylase AcuC-like enzyme